MEEVNFKIPPRMKEAIYKQSSIKEFQGNPLIEALPQYVEASEIADNFGRFPTISDAEKLLSKADRTLLVSRLNNYLEPLPAHYDIIEKINLIVRAGYAFRNPLDDVYRKNRVELYRKAMDGQVCAIEDSGPSTAPSFALFGTSGVGKSTVVDRTLAFLPQVLIHSKFKFTQVVWLKVDCPLDGSLKQLLLSILAKLDSLLDSSYVKQVGSKRTVDELILSVAKITAMHNVGVLVIDEIQNLLDASGVGQSKMLNFFVTFANEVKIPVVTIGTPRAMDLLIGTFREARRVGDHGTCVWDRLDQKEWPFFIRGLWKYQWTDNFIPLTDELSDEMREQSQGIHALVVRLFQLTQLQALRENKEGISRELIIRVAEDKFKLVKPMLKALKANNKKEIAGYHDLLDMGIKDLSKQVDLDAKMMLLEAGSQKRDRQNERMNAVCALVAMKYKEDQIQEIVTNLFNMHPDLTSERAVRMVLDATEKNKGTSASEESLVEIAKKAAGISPFDALAKAGLIVKEKAEI